MTVNPKVNPKKLRPYDEPPRRRRSLIPSAPDNAATAFIVGAALWMALATGLGALAVLMRIVSFDVAFGLGVFDLSFEFNQARVETAFVNATVYGWLGNAGFAAVAFMTPRLVGRRLAGEAWVFLAFLVWNLAALGGLAALYVFDPGPNQPLTAIPWFIDGGLALGALILTGSFAATVGTAVRSAYVSIWFAGVALLAVLGLTSLNAGLGLLDFVFGLPEVVVGLASAYIERGLLLLWLLPIAYATLYYVVPRVASQPLESIGIGFLAWVTWLLPAPVAALAVVIDTQVPYFVTSLATAASIALLVPAALTAVNLTLTVRGRWSLLFGSGPLAFAAMAVVFLLGATLLDAIGTLASVRAFVGGTDWPSGAFVWMTLGAFSLAALAGFEHAVPRVLRREWGGTPISAAKMWATFAGSTIGGVGLMGAGLAAGSFRAQAADPETTAAGLVGYEVVALIGLGLVALGGLLALVNLFMAYTTSQPAEYAIPGGPATAAAGH